MRVVFQEKKLRERERERERENHINLSTPMNLYNNIYPSNTNKYVKVATRKKNVGAREILKKDHW